MIEIGVLGSLEVRLVGLPVVPTAAKPRTLLALLAVHADRFVPIELAVGELWGASPPRKSKAVIQTYVLQLRKLIAKAVDRQSAGNPVTVSKRILATEPSGYMLNSGVETDAVHFEKMAEAGHRALEKGDFPEASKRFAEGLAVWRGRALADVQQGTYLDAELRRLEEMRLNVLDCRIGADLKIGRHHEVLGELTALSASHPTHEGLCAHLMLALYRSGRRLEALGVYRRLRTDLVAGAGLEPSPALRRLHRSMLTPDRMHEDVTESWRTATVQPAVVRVDGVQTAGARSVAPADRVGSDAVSSLAISAEVAAAAWVPGEAMAR